MRSWKTAIVACLVFSAQATAGPQASSRIGGVVLNHLGETVAEAPVRAVHVSTGTEGRTFSGSDGSYSIRDLPAGNYVVSVVMSCCAFAPYANDSVVLGEGEALELEIRLGEGGSLNALGDDPGTIAAELRDRQVIPDLPVPRTAGGRPDLSGVWLVWGDPYPEQPQALPWAEEISRERIASEFRDHPHTRCLPSWLPVPAGGTPSIGKFVQTPDLLVILFEDVPGYRQIFLDGRSHPENPNPSWMGHSIGRWEGDTLVVETVGFNGRGWNGSYPSTETTRLEERYTRSEYGAMDVQVTTEDPAVFVEPWVSHRRFDLAPQEELIEYVCENNKWESD